MPATKCVMHVTMRWGDGRGGVKQFIHNAVKALPKDEYRQAVASLGPVSGDGQGLTVFGPVARSAKPIGRHGMRDMVRFFERESPDIVHIHCNNGVGLFCAEAARRAGLAVRVVHSHNSSLGGDELWKRVGDVGLKMLYSDAPTVRVACSDVAGDWLFGRRPYAIIRNGIEVRRFSFDPRARRDVRAELGIGGGMLVLGHIGSGIPVKNAAFIIDLVRVLVDHDLDVCALLVGSGEEINALRARVRDEGVSERIRFAGVVADPWRYYSAMDAFLLPSFYEGLPISLIEAQANGLPCIASGVVSRESNVTGLVSFLSLDAGGKGWADPVVGAARKGATRGVADSERFCRTIVDAGFSLETLGRQLEDLYEQS